jgi:C1A family cysteine protease
MRTFATALFMSIASAKILDQLDVDFINYVVKHNKNYVDLTEFNLRRELFAKADAEIKEIQATETTSQHGHNFLSDWTAVEKEGLLGLTMPPQERTNVTSAVLPPEQLPSSVNWCTAGACNPIQNQGSCGSCWAFSAAASMESAHYIQQGSLYKLSEQQFVSCSSAFGNAGCNGGWYYAAWQYSETNPVESESNYPYTSGTGGVTGSCACPCTLGIGKATSYTQIGTTTAAIMTAVASQPASVAIDARTMYFQSYTSGVLTSPQKCGSQLDHAVVAVGYGTDPTAGGYWIVRNSWGTGWGNQGYVWIGNQAAYPGVCGIDQQVYTV